MTIEAIKVLDKLHRCHATAKRFFAEEFTENILPYKKLITSYAKEKGIDVLPAVTAICEDGVISNNGWTVILLMAAAVELIENA